VKADGRDDEGQLGAPCYSGRRRGADTSSMERTLPTIAKRLRALERTDINAWLERGELLTVARDLCAGDRDFAAWLRSTATPRRTAYRAMAAWRDFGTVPTRHKFTREAMDLLGRSEAARNAALQLSATARVTARIARSLLRQYSTAAPPAAANKSTATKRVIVGDGFTVTINFDHAATDADVYAAIMHAHRTLRDGISRAA
jgi:hypothetical protein